MHEARVIWQSSGDFAANRYTRGHLWRFDGGAEVKASASPSVVPVPLSDPAAVDPEEAFLASISSCHMLWFLDFSRQAGFEPTTYEDRATGALVSDGGRMWIPRVDLNIRVTWAEAPDADTHKALHDKAHHACFIANSVRSEIVVNLLENTP
ncbi:OsmC family protein [Gymnodinialimonas ceratoperidinii]|uniref:OsmC family protein n=1 Tax=Gymnodinialimonas ceratoperidinii TaxID=2856823 RepID=A0A8F6YCL1_9RHOB|nr:OsmC family protein [Gymnodinialimonas ceratoperidinii]QXT39322.1 OsmC family protein [Gymnodinialimonas ceratoperidinii]